MSYAENEMKADGVPAADGPLASALAELSTELAKLDGVLSYQRERLKPVLAPTVEPGKPEPMLAEVRSNLSPTTATVLDLTMKVVEMHRFVDRTTSRLDI